MWHEAAEPECPLFGRYRSENGHHTDGAIRCVAKELFDHLAGDGEQFEW
jgi:hypothetical protein